MFSCEVNRPMSISRQTSWSLVTFLTIKYAFMHRNWTSENRCLYGYVGATLFKDTPLCTVFLPFFTHASRVKEAFSS